GRKRIGMSITGWTTPFPFKRRTQQRKPFALKFDCNLTRIRHFCKRGENVNLPFGYLSVSQVRAYLRCPRMYELQYIEGLRSPLTSFLLLGRSFHKAIEMANRAKLEDGEILSVEEVQDTFSEAWDREK